MNNLSNSDITNACEIAITNKSVSTLTESQVKSNVFSAMCINTEKTDGFISDYAFKTVTSATINYVLVDDTMVNYDSLLMLHVIQNDQPEVLVVGSSVISVKVNDSDFKICKLASGESFNCYLKSGTTFNIKGTITLVPSGKTGYLHCAYTLCPVG